MFKTGDRILCSEYGEGTVVSDYRMSGIHILVKRDDGDGWIGGPDTNLPPHGTDLHGVSGLWWTNPTYMRLIQSSTDYEMDA